MRPLLILLLDCPLDVRLHPGEYVTKQPVRRPAHRQPREYLLALLPKSDVLRERLARYPAPHPGPCDSVEDCSHRPRAIVTECLRPIQGPGHQVKIVED